MRAERAPRATGRRPVARPEQADRIATPIFQHSLRADSLAVREALHAALTRFLQEMSADEAGTLELILAEVLNNIVEHSYTGSGDGTISISIVRDRKGLSCAVSDDGVPLPEDCLRQVRGDDPGRPPPSTLPEGGFGWFLIRDLAEDLGYSRKDGHNLLAFRIPLRRLEQAAHHKPGA